MNKKSQAAMEFIMVYGWAIFVVLIAIGALWYFGVLNPDNFTDKCKCIYIGDMTYSGSITENNITYTECFETEQYLDYEAKKIRFNTTYKLFYCDEDLNQLIEVE